MIDIRELTLSYPGVTVLDVPELTVADGALTYLIGLNGTGKTTLLRCICGIIAPAAGTVRVDGTPVQAHRSTPATLGMHLNYRAFDPRHTARRHLRWIARARGLPVGRVGDVLEIVDLVRFADRRLGHYSLGMLQRVGIAAALRIGDIGEGGGHRRASHCATTPASAPIGSRLKAAAISALV